MNPEIKTLKSINPNLVSERYTEIAEVFKCYLCFMIPLKFSVCTNKRCEVFVCIDCQAYERCLKCDDQWGKNTERKGFDDLHDLINVICPNSSAGCALICSIKDIKSHYEECPYGYNNPLFLINQNPNQINNIQPQRHDLNSLVKNPQKEAENLDKNQSKEENPDSDSSSEENPCKFRLEELKRNRYVVLLDSTELQEFEKNQLRDALVYRKLDTNGTKAQLAHR